MPIPQELIPFDPKHIKLIRNVLTIAEQGTQTIPYGKVEVMNDGPGDKAQVTLSIGFTEYGGNLKRVLARYVDRGGLLAARMAAYIPFIGSKPLAQDKAFKSLLREAASDSIMAEVQEDCFEEFYLAPAFKFCKENGLALPLSYLVVCDSFLHSGSILSFLRKKFPAALPAKTLDQEKLWIRQYTSARHEWLSTHSNKLLRNTIYRTTYYKSLLSGEDWMLERAHEIAMHGTKPLKIV